MFVGMGANSGGGYNLESSLRLRSSASAYLSRTPTVAGNQTTWTWSAWVKRSKIGTQSGLFSAYNNDNNRAGFGFDSTDKMYVFRRAGGTTTYSYQPDMLFRDTSAWYHIVVKMDQSQSTASDRLQIYVNGQLLTNDNGDYPALNEGGTINNTRLHTIGRQGLSGGSNYFDGYITEVNHIDGQALDADSFGEYDDITGVWKPKAYTGTYGTNGFYLEGCRGTDQSGNGNDYTENNFNTTTLSPLSTAQNYDVMSDVPTLTDEDTGNFPTYNILFPLSTSTLQSGNQKLNNSGTSSWRHAISSIALPNTGKWYFEMVSGTDSNNGTMGLAPVESLANGSNGYVTDAILTNTPNSSGTASGGLAGSTQTWTGTYNIDAYDALACAVDMDNNKVWFRIGSNWVNAGSGAGDPSAGTNPAVSGGINSNKTYHFVTSAYAQNHWVNFGQRPFQYTPPTGFKKLNTYNLPDSTIKDGSQYMNTVTYTGDGDLTSHPITGVGFSPDWIWIKRRDSANSHQTYDSVRTLGYVLSTDKTDAEADETSKFVSIDSDGFTIKSNAGSHNLLNATYVAWNWRASDSSAVSNTDGTITSTVSANTTSGFSVVTYTGNGSASTIGHGLGTAPSVIILKQRTGAAGDVNRQWVLGHNSLGWTKSLKLSTTDAELTSTPIWNDTTPTSSVFTIGNSNTINYTNSTYVSYCFAEVEGFSKFGSYTGNGSTDGPFIYTGFRPAFVLVKRTSGVNAWNIMDKAREGYNPQNDLLFPDSSNAESNVTDQDILSNGFKLRTTGSGRNGNGENYIYMAFAENPFKQSLAR